MKKERRTSSVPRSRGTRDRKLKSCVPSVAFSSACTAGGGRLERDACVRRRATRRRARAHLDVAHDGGVGGDGEEAGLADDAGHCGARKRCVRAARPQVPRNRALGHRRALPRGERVHGAVQFFVGHGGVERVERWVARGRGAGAPEDLLEIGVLCGADVLVARGAIEGGRAGVIARLNAAAGGAVRQLAEDARAAALHARGRRPSVVLHSNRAFCCAKGMPLCTILLCCSRPLCLERQTDCRSPALSHTVLPYGRSELRCPARNDWAFDPIADQSKARSDTTLQASPHLRLLVDDAADEELEEAEEAREENRGDDEACVHAIVLLLERQRLAQQRVYLLLLHLYAPRSAGSQGTGCLKTREAAQVRWGTHHGCCCTGARRVRLVRGALLAGRTGACTEPAAT